MDIDEIYDILALSVCPAAFFLFGLALFIGPRRREKLRATPRQRRIRDTDVFGFVSFIIGFIVVACYAAMYLHLIGD